MSNSRYISLSSAFFPLSTASFFKLIFSFLNFGFVFISFISLNLSLSNFFAFSAFSISPLKNSIDFLRSSICSFVPLLLIISRLFSASFNLFPRLLICSLIALLTVFDFSGPNSNPFANAFAKISAVSFISASCLKRSFPCFPNSTNPFPISFSFAAAAPKS